MAASQCVYCTMRPPCCCLRTLRPKPRLLASRTMSQLSSAHATASLPRTPLWLAVPRSRDECLSHEWFRSREEARLVIET